jgi:hypothetical protein
MDLTAEFYSKASHLNSYPIYSGRPNQSGGFFRSYNSPGEMQRAQAASARSATKKLAYLLAGIAGAVKLQQMKKKRKA